MNIASINISDYGSTGRIMLYLSDYARRAGHDSVTYSRNWWGNRIRSGHFFFGYKTEHLIHHALGIITGMEGTFSFYSTAELIKQLNSFHPDILHLHNLHGWYINLSLLFDYIKQNHVKVVWTLHDCWPFTGHCPYFDYVGCEKWISGCRDCPQYRDYPESLTDNSARMYEKKKSLFSGVKDLTVVCPSSWLAELVGKSFLGSYDIRVIHNGIDTSVFRNTSSSFRADHGIMEDDRMILGVASGWAKRKGIDVFPGLKEQLGDKYKIVVAGIEKGDLTRTQLPDGTITIERTTDLDELAQMYSAADVFVNPTREDNYPTVNLEAISCGTPVVTFDTGGSAEAIASGCGISVSKDDIKGMADAVRTICKDRFSYSENCNKASCSFDIDRMAEQYLSLYEELIER